MSRHGILGILAMMILQAGLMGKDADPVMFGPYQAITIENEVIRGVKVDDEGKIWLLLNPIYLDRELRLKISEKEGAGYRKWYTGEYELVSPANQDKVKNSWTDWIQTKSTYIEYWMDGKKILHLKKVK